MDRYLNPKEKERYPKWLEEQEARRAELEEKRKNRQILSTAPKETLEQEAEEVSAEHYEYHLGDTVYIGASEYEILSFDDERVIHRKRPVVAPGEMEEIKLTKEQLLQYPDLKTITVKIERE